MGLRMMPDTDEGRPYLRRIVDDELDELLPQLAAVLLDGPKGVGKTSTALQRSQPVRRLDRSGERSVLEADPRVIARDQPPVLLDEWQRVPELWDTVRDLVDHDHAAGRFLLTGSPPGPDLHSGAARIATVRVRPLVLSERGVGTPTVSFRELLGGQRPSVGGRSALVLGDYVDEIMASGFPGMRHLTGRPLVAQLDGYLDRIVDHELREAGFVLRRPAAVRAWMAAYAAATATTASWETIRDAASAGHDVKPSRITTNRYSDFLRSLRILDPIDAWIPTSNYLGRLGSTPKHHLVDPALAVRLVGCTRGHLLRGGDGSPTHARDGTYLGALFESLVALTVRTYAQAAAARTFHLRDRSGRHEVDFIVEHDGGVLALEAKLGATAESRDVRHLIWLAEALGDRLTDMVVVTTGPEAYRRNDGVAVIPLGLLGA